MRWFWHPKAPTPPREPPKTPEEHARERRTYDAIGEGLDMAAEGVRVAREEVERLARLSRKRAADPWADNAFPEGPRR